jgi:hypothetical protein
MAAARPVFNVNLFSNVASADPSRALAGHAALSFLDALRAEASHDVVLRLFCDPSPNPQAFDAWTEAAAAPLAPRRVEIHRTRGLADGYAGAIELAEGPYALMLEHDWMLRARLVPHALADLLAGMAQAGIRHLRFNKRWNRAVGYDHFMEPDARAPFPACRVSGRSNNPHILDVAHARARVLPFIDRAARKAEGLEGRLELFAGGGHVYGGLGHPATAGHLDGRALRWRDGMRRRRFLARAAAAAD